MNLLVFTKWNMNKYIPRLVGQHDPEEIWARTQDVIKGAMKRAGATADDIAAVGITNQRETTVV